MSDAEWAHVLLMKLKKLRDRKKREDAVLALVTQIRHSERRRVMHALHVAVEKLVDDGNS